MAFEAYLQRARGPELFDASPPISKIVVEGKQLGAETQNGNIDGRAVELLKIFLPGRDYRVRDALSLVRRIDCQHTKVALSSAEF